MALQSDLGDNPRMFHIGDLCFCYVDRIWCNASDYCISPASVHLINSSWSRAWGMLLSILMLALRIRPYSHQRIIRDLAQRKPILHRVRRSLSVLVDWASACWLGLYGALSSRCELVYARRSQDLEWKAISNQHVSIYDMQWKETKAIWLILTPISFL